MTFLETSPRHNPSLQVLILDIKYRMYQFIHSFLFGNLFCTSGRVEHSTWSRSTHILVAIMILPCQISYAIKTQLKTPKGASLSLYGLRLTSWPIVFKEISDLHLTLTVGRRVNQCLKWVNGILR